MALTTWLLLAGLFVWSIAGMVVFFGAMLSSWYDKPRLPDAVFLMLCGPGAWLFLVWMSIRDRLVRRVRLWP
jgi:hypothetical protein